MFGDDVAEVDVGRCWTLLDVVGAWAAAADFAKKFLLQRVRVQDP